MRDTLPHILAVIAEVAGESAMLRVAQNYGGQRVKLPGNFARGNWLTRLVGREHAEAIVRALGSGTIDVPLGPAGSYAALRRQLNRQYADLRDAQASEAEVARAMGITTRAVRYRRRKDREALPDMFGQEALPGRE